MVDFLVKSDMDMCGHEVKDACAENVEELPEGISGRVVLYRSEKSGLLCYYDAVLERWVSLASLPMTPSDGDVPAWEDGKWGTMNLTTAIRILGVVETYDDLPEDPTQGDTYIVREPFRDCPAGTGVFWNSEVWVPLSGVVEFGGVAFVDPDTAKEGGDILMWDADKEVWVPTSALESGFALAGDLQAHVADTTNPHQVTKEQIGLGNVDNTSDMDKPVSTATQIALATKVDQEDFDDHLADYDNPHQVTKAQVGLDQVDNTSDMDKPVSTAQQAALDLKQDTITGGATSITDQDLTPNRALISSENGKVGTSNVTSAEIDFLDGVHSNIQEQIDAKASAEVLTTHLANYLNPHQVTAEQVGLGNVDNTSDEDKPISTATQAALDELYALIQGGGGGGSSVSRLTVTGDGTSKELTASHNLGAVPAVMILDPNGKVYHTDTTVTDSDITLSFNTAPAAGTTYTLVVIA